MLLIPKSFRAYVFHVHELSVFIHLLYTDDVYGVWLEVVPYVLMYTVNSFQFAKPPPPQINKFFANIFNNCILMKASITSEFHYFIQPQKQFL